MAKKRINIDVRQRIDILFDLEIKDIIKQRITKGKDDPLKPKSHRRITAAFRRHDLFPLIKKEVIESELKDDIDA